eukprot:GHVR01052405.1.p1 GENE.GHVR01052405.1~~GHVR01052405.1.p1  ORF type:complete len:497 (+),score=150.85 GHVR01052405.1:49-1539(+)
MMADFLKRIPAPKHEEAIGSFKVTDEPVDSNSNTLEVVQIRSIPPYGHRQGWVPRTASDFGDGGAYPEVLVAQYPQDIGRPGQSGAKTVALMTGADGKLQYDAVIKQGSNQIMQTRPQDQVAGHSREERLVRPTEEDQRLLADSTKNAVQLALIKKMGSTTRTSSACSQPQFVRYTPDANAPGRNTNINERVVRMVEKQVDILEPPKFKHKKMPRGGGSPPPTIQHSPPRKLTAQDQKDWKIPPCVSNWKNQKGYTVPLDKRLQADGRQLKDSVVNDKFASLAEDLYIAERKAREEIKLRGEMLKQQKAVEEQQREEELRTLAKQSKEERDLIRRAEARGEDEARRVREQIEVKRKREIERDFRLEQAGKKSKASRDEGRDVSETIALGTAAPTSQEGMYDARLFNQTAGMNAGFRQSEDGEYDIYDKPMWADRGKLSQYHHQKDRLAQNAGTLGSVPGIGSTDDAPSKYNTGRTAPVEFEKDSDPFGMENLYKKK